MAAHVLTVLAYKRDQDVSSALLAANVNTNLVIICRLLLALPQAKLVQTRRGAGFGSRLARPAGRINPAEVCRAVEYSLLSYYRAGSLVKLAQCEASSTQPWQVFASARTARERDLARRTLAGVLQTATSVSELPQSAEGIELE